MVNVNPKQRHPTDYFFEILWIAECVSIAHDKELWIYNDFNLKCQIVLQIIWKSSVFLKKVNPKCDDVHCSVSGN